MPNLNDRGLTDIKPYSLQHIFNQSFDRDAQVVAIEGLGFDGQNVQKNNADNLAMQLDYNGGDNPVYIGLAAPGSLTSEAKWQVRKLTYDGTNPTVIKYANGSSSFNQIYDDRASLTYT